MQLGIVVNDLGQNQESFMAVNRVNSMLHNKEHSITLFYKELSGHFIKCAGATMTLDRIYHFDGNLIVTNLDLAKFALKSYAPKKIMLYMFDLDWLRGENNYLENISIYNNKNMLVVVPSEEYKKELYNYSGKVADAVIPRFDINAMIKVME